MIANVRKSNRLLTGPKKTMNLRMKAMSQCAGARSCSGSTRSVGMVSWLASYSRLLSRIWLGSIGRKLSTAEAAAALNMLPKLLLVPISTYLIVLAKMRLSLIHISEPTRLLSISYAVFCLKKKKKKKQKNDNFILLISKNNKYIK